MSECEYDDGKISSSELKIEIKPWFIQMLDYFWDNRKSIRKMEGNQSFDYPDYFGLPKEVIKNLSGEEVDKIQDYQHELFYSKSVKSRKQFVKKFIDLILNSNSVKIDYNKL